MPLKKHDYLLTICSRTVMFFLVADVESRFFDSGNIDAEGTISFLPTTGPKRGKSFMNPFGGITLEKLHGLGDRHCGGQT